MKLNISIVNPSTADLRRGLKLPQELTPELAEDIGIMLGDGHIGRYVSHGKVTHQISVAGSYDSDEPYFSNHLIPLKKKLFGLDFHLGLQRDNELYIAKASRGLFSFYNSVIGLKSGRKNDAGIPEIIMDSDSVIKSAFLRGLADTDFSLVFGKMGRSASSYHVYPSIKCRFQSRKLVENLTVLFDELGFKVTTCFSERSLDKRSGRIDVRHVIYVYGKNNLHRWMINVGFNNPKHLTKYKIWRKFGFCPPGTILSEREGILSGMLDPYSYVRSTGPGGFEPPA